MNPPPLLQGAAAEVVTPVPDHPPTARAGPCMAAFRDAAPVGAGFVPLGLAFGIYLTHSGLAWWWATLFSGLIFAGSFEFLLVGLIAAAAPLPVIAVTALLVNVRHVFYALSFPLHRIRGFARAYSTFGLCDEAFALTTAPSASAWPASRILSLQAFLHVYWLTSATAGALLGSLVPVGVTGLEFALTALFVVLATDAVRDGRHDLTTPVMALSAALLARVVAPGQLLPTAFALFTGALLVRRRIIGRETADA